MEEEEEAWWQGSRAAGASGGGGRPVRMKESNQVTCKRIPLDLGHSYFF